MIGAARTYCQRIAVDERPGLAIAAGAGVAINLVGQGLNDALNPQLLASVSLDP